jgi:hypothetical protein
MSAITSPKLINVVDGNSAACRIVYPISEFNGKLIILIIRYGKKITVYT